MNLAIVKLFSLQTLHYGTIRPTALEMDIFNITNKLILAGIFLYTHVCPRSHVELCSKQAKPQAKALCGTSTAVWMCRTCGRAIELVCSEHCTASTCSKRVHSLLWGVATWLTQITLGRSCYYFAGNHFTIPQMTEWTQKLQSGCAVCVRGNASQWISQ